MAANISKTGFFKTKMTSADAETHAEQKSKKVSAEVPVPKEPAPEQTGAAPVRSIDIKPFQIPSQIAYIQKKAVDSFRQNGLSSFAKSMEKIMAEEKKELFTIVVVGEFSRGKSTFINTLLEKEYLPVGNLPTTAMLTRIRYNSKDTMVLFNEKGQKTKTLPLSKDVWDGLTADNFGGQDPDGVAVLGVKNQWLADYKLEVMDTPGAGDLEERRVRVIGDALFNSDGAIITISAARPLSESERLFIEQRLLSRRVPFLMLIVTKLDLIATEERSNVLKHIKDRLHLMKADIPVFIPGEIDMPDHQFDDCIGMDKIKREIASWVTDPERSERIVQWITARMDNVLEMAIGNLEEQIRLRQSKGDAKTALIEEKKKILLQAESTWEDLKVQMEGRCLDCRKSFWEKVDELKAGVIERLQHESSRIQNPAKWWKEEYPYRVRTELANLAVGVDNVISRKISEDGSWFNRALNEKFKTRIQVEKVTIAERERYGTAPEEMDLGLKDVQKQRTIVRTGTTAISMVGSIALSLSGLGMFSIISTTGVSTGSSLLSEKFFEGRIEQQKKLLSNAIAEGIPRAISEATSESEQRIQMIYHDMINEASMEQKTWLEAQRAALENSSQNDGPDDNAKQQRMIEEFRELQNKLHMKNMRGR